MTFNDENRAGIATLGLVAVACTLITALAYGAVKGQVIDVVCATLGGAVVQGLINIARTRNSPPTDPPDTTTQTTTVKKTVPPKDP